MAKQIGTKNKSKFELISITSILEMVGNLPETAKIPVDRTWLDSYNVLFNPQEDEETEEVEAVPTASKPAIKKDEDEPIEGLTVTHFN